MEALYDDLENYNEVNSVAELRNENKDLKLKLEEYEMAMGKLQKDYDNLALEFSNLQTNYSSLLKTARAEVERKTKMITQLHVEKETMIIQSLQQGNRRLYSNRNKSKETPTHINKVTDKKNKAHIKNEQRLKVDDKIERSETSSISTNVSVASTNHTTLLNIVDKVVNKVEAHIGNGELKESTPKVQASNIKNRRKSMPAVGLSKFSSDEEYEPKKPNKPILTNDPTLTEKADGKLVNNIVRHSNEKVNKTSETSSMDDRSSNYQELLKEVPRHRSNKERDSGSDNNKFTDRNRDNKCRETRTRDNNRFRDNRFRSNDRFRESDRARENNRLKDNGRFRDNDRHRDIDRYKDSDRDYDRLRDTDRYKEGNRHCDKSKESIQRDYEKYSGKDKNESSQRHRKHYSPDRTAKRYRDNKDDQRCEYGRPRVDSLPLVYPHRNQDDRGLERHYPDRDKTRPHNEERHARKRSVSNDNIEPVCKRQRVVSDIPVDEVRTHDIEGQYHDIGLKLLRPELQDHELLGTSCQSPDSAFSHDSTPSHSVKEIKYTATVALEDPRATSKKYVLKTGETGKTTLIAAVSNNIVMTSIDKSIWNIDPVGIPEALSYKSGLELNDEQIKDIYINFHDTEVNTSRESGEISSDLNNDVFDIGKERPIKKTGLGKLCTEVAAAPKSKLENSINVTQTYRIPKIKKNEQNSSNIPNTLKVLPKNTDVLDYKNHPRISPSSIRPQSQNIDKHDPTTHDKNKTKSSASKDDKLDKIALSDIAMVQDDLELSDETSDNVDLHRKIVENEIVHKQSTEHKKKVLPEDNIKHVPFINIDEQLKVSDESNHKKQKSKKRKTKSKEKESNDYSNSVQVSEKKNRSKKDKEPKHMKSKFTYLFGDSNSLITPEDLGIPAPCVPLCEDAVDINIKAMINVLPSLDAHNVCDTRSSNFTQEVLQYGKPNPDNVIIANSREINTDFENVNSEVDTGKTDVVKTVIISAGVQPQFATDNNEVFTEKRVADVEVNIQNVPDCNQFPAIMELKKQNSMKALATSTPHKDLDMLQALDTDYKTGDSLNQSTDSRNSSVNTAGISIDQSDTNTQSNQGAPDVRIFVRRRRKGAKKS